MTLILKQTLDITVKSICVRHFIWAEFETIWNNENIKINTKILKATKSVKSVGPKLENVNLTRYFDEMDLVAKYLFSFDVTNRKKHLKLYLRSKIYLS